MYFYIPDKMGKNKLKKRIGNNARTINPSKSLFQIRTEKIK